METSVNNGMCRCCASEGAFKDVKSTYHWMGEEEIYADMLRDCFDINLHVSERGEEYSGICEVCITQLRNAINFKKQVLHTEEQFKKHMQNKSMFRPNIVKVEVQHEDSDDNIASGDDDFSADFEVPIKTEESEEPKPKKRAAKTVMTTRSKKTKIDIGETSTKRVLHGVTVNDHSEKKPDDGKFRRIIPVKTITQLNRPVKSTIQLNKPMKTTMLLNTPIKTSMMLNKSVKTTMPLNKPVKSTTPLYRPVKSTTLLNKPVKSTTLLNRPVKSTTLLNKPVKSTTLLNKPVKSTTLLNKPVKSTTPLNKPVKLTTQVPKLPHPNQYSMSGEIIKRRHNTEEILRWSNATPIKQCGDLGYMCCFCKDHYPNPADLKTHNLEKHKDVTQASIVTSSNYIVKVDITGLRCNICKKDMDTTEILMDHLKDEHNKIIHTDIKNHIIPFKFTTDVIECFICKNVFSKFRLLAEHMSKHYRNFICEVCDTAFINSLGLKHHVARHENGSFQCESCPLIFNTIRKKKNHIKRKHTNNKRGEHKCGYCLETFTDYRKKETHLAAVHGVKLEMSKCQACDRVFKHRKSLAVHVKKDHLMERNHKCLHCDKRFFCPSAMRKHMTKHTGYKPYKCTICLKSFSHQGTLRKHKRIHDDDRRFRCDHCGQAFVQKCSWRIHMKTKHNEIV